MRKLRHYLGRAQLGTRGPCACEAGVELLIRNERGPMTEPRGARRRDRFLARGKQRIARIAASLLAGGDGNGSHLWMVWKLR